MNSRQQYRFTLYLTTAVVLVWLLHRTEMPAVTGSMNYHPRVYHFNKWSDKRGNITANCAAVNTKKNTHIY